MDTDETIELDLNEPINWEDIDEEYSGDVSDMNYVHVFEESDEGKFKFNRRISILFVLLNSPKMTMIPYC